MTPGVDRVLVEVVQLQRDVPGGIGTYARGLLQGLGELGAPAPGSAPAPLLPEVALWAGRRAGSSGDDPLGTWGRPVLRSALPVPVLIRAWSVGLAAAPASFDVLHSVSTVAPPVRRIGRRRGGAPAPALVVTVHDLAWRRHPEATTGRGRRWHERALLRALRRADAFVVPSLAVAADLEAAGAATDRVSVIAEGSDHLPAPDHGAARSALARAGVAGGYVLSVGTLEPRKNLARVVRAYAMCRPELPEPWPLVVVGPAGWGTGLGEPPPGVVALGKVSDDVLAGLYAGARLLVYAPLTEGYGLPPLEAMRQGTPVVASTEVPSVRWEQGAAARLVSPTDVEGLAAALLEVAGDESERRRLVAAGETLVGQRTWREAAQAHLDLWHRVR